jgi:hypothetical protein
MRDWLDGLPLMIKYLRLLFNGHFLTFLDYQSIDVIDSLELRELLLYVSPHLDKVDVQHRTKLPELITAGFKRKYLPMLKDIEVRLHDFLLSFLVLRDNRTRLGGYRSQVLYGPAKILNHIWQLFSQVLKVW